MVKYLELYPGSLTMGLGIITAISVIDDIPWSTLSAAEIMDLERAYGLRSANKNLVSTFVVAPPEVRERMICSFFKHKWQKLWNIHHLEYNQLDAYIVTEKGSKTTERSRESETKFGRTITDTVKDTTSINTENSDNNSSTDSVYGFNSAMPVPSGSGIGSRVNNGTVNTDYDSDKTVVNSGQDEASGTSNEIDSYEYEKRGNIGYSTPQKMLREEISLWVTPFFEIVFSDIDSLITLSVYE